MLRPRLITRYTLRQLVPPTLLGLALYTFVLLMNHFFLVAQTAVSKGLGTELTLRLFLVGIPRLLVLSLPMAVLLGTMIGIGRMSADHEWVALQAAGQGLSSLLRPVLIHGLVGVALCLWIYGVVVPGTNYAQRKLRGRILLASNLAADLKPRVFYDLPGQAVLFVDDIRPGVPERRLQGVLLIQPDESSGSMQLVVAREGDLFPAPEGDGGVFVDLYDGRIHLFGSDPDSSYRVSSFGLATRRRLDPPAYLKALLDPPQRVVQDMTLSELWREVREADRARLVNPPSTGSRRPPALVAERRFATAKIEAYQRLALPLASLLFALLALPLGLTRVRSGKGAGFALSLAVLLVYWFTFVLTRNQAAVGRLSPFVGVWTADFVVLVWALVALWRVGRRETGGGALRPRLQALQGAVRRFLPRRVQGDRAPAEGAARLAPIGGTSTRFVGRLDRYIGLTYLRMLGLAVASAYLIYGLVELQRLAEGLLRSGQPPSLLVSYYKYFAPTVFHNVLPPACLAAAVIAFALLSRNNELVATTANGIGLRRTTLPVLALTLGLCALQFLVEDRLTPPASRRAESLKDQILGRAPRTHGLPVTGRWGFGPDGQQLYHYRVWDPKLREFRELSVLTLDRSAPRVVDHRYTGRARWVDGAWEMEGGWYRTFSPDTFERYEAPYRVELALPQDIVEQHLRSVDDDLPAQLSVAEIREEILRLEKSGYDSTRMRVAYHGKFADSFAPLVMVLLGLPFAFRLGRHGSLYAVGVAFVLVLVYWATFAVFNALGLETLLHPAVAAWTPDVFFGLLGTYLMLYIRT